MERRQVSTLGLLWRHYLWVPLIPAIISAAFLNFAASEFSDANLLRQHGVTVPGQIINREVTRRRSTDGPNATNYYVTYGFRTLAGQEARGREEVSISRYNALLIGSPVAVTYAEVDPSVSTLTPGARRFSGWLLAAGGVLAGLGAVVLGWVMVKQKRSALRAARDGELRQARVSALNPGSLRVKGEQYYQMQWIDAAGQTGQSRSYPMAKLPPRDAVIVVYVDPVTGKGWWENDL